MNLTTLAMYPAKWRQIQMGVLYPDILEADLFSVANATLSAICTQLRLSAGTSLKSKGGHAELCVTAFTKINSEILSFVNKAKGFYLKYFRLSTDFLCMENVCVEIYFAGYNLVRAHLQASQWRGAYKSFLSLYSLS